MDAIKELININFSYVLMSVFLILIGVKTILTIFEWIVQKLGLETKWMRQKREEHELLIHTSQNLASLQSRHLEDMKRSDQNDAKMKEDIKKLTDLFIDKQINDYRWEIINLADRIASGRNISRECLRHAISTYEKYEKIITDYGLVNGEVELSIEVIRESYQQKLKEGF